MSAKFLKIDKLINIIYLTCSSYLYVALCEVWGNLIMCHACITVQWEWCL